MPNKEINKGVQALGDDFLGQVSGGVAISEEAKNAILKAVERERKITGGWNYWDAQGIPDPHQKNEKNIIIH